MSLPTIYYLSISRNSWNKAKQTESSFSPQENNFGTLQPAWKSILLGMQIQTALSRLSLVDT